MNAQTAIKPESRADTPFGKQVRREHALEDLRREFERRWQSLLAEFEVRKRAVEREYR